MIIQGAVLSWTDKQMLVPAGKVVVWLVVRVLCRQLTLCLKPVFTIVPYYPNRRKV